MIKKIITLAIAILLIAMPLVSADSAGPPVHNGDEVVEIKLKSINTEVEINGWIECDLLVTNITNDVLVTSYEFITDTGRVYKKMDAVAVGNQSVEVFIGPMETVELTLIAHINDYKLQCYRKDDGFFVDAYLHVRLHKEDSDEYVRYEIDMESVPIEITNVKDGNDIFRINWLDGRDKLYYFFSSESYANEDESDVFVGRAYYEVSIDKIGEDYSHLQTIDYPFFKETKTEEEMGDTLSLYYGAIHEYEGIYYYIDAVREYETVRIDKPEISILITPVTVDYNPHKDVYDWIIKNESSEPIENLYIHNYFETGSGLDYTEKTLLMYNRYGTLGVDEQWHLRFEQYEGLDHGRIDVGYHFDGVSYLWDMFVDLPAEGEEIFYVKDGYEFSHVDQDKEILPDVVEYPQMDFDLLFDETPTPAYSPTDAPATAAPEITAAPTTCAQVVVQKRYKPMVTVFIIICLLLVASAVVTVITIRKIIREKNTKEDKDD